MTRPDLNGPGDYENPDYNFTANLPNPATGGLNQYSQMQRGDWENYEAGKWQSKTEGIGEGVDIQRTIMSAVVLAFKGDMGGLVELFGSTIIAFIRDLDVLKVIQGLTSGLTGPLLTAAQLLGIRWDQADANEQNNELLKLGIVNGFRGTTGSVTIDQVPEVMQSIRAALINGYTVETFTYNQTWNRDPNAVYTEFYPVAIGGGGKGFTGQSNVGNNSTTYYGGDPGRHGGYISESIPDADIPTALHWSVGAAASVPGADGGVTSCELVSSIPAANGMWTIGGYAPTTSAPGAAGKGGNAVYSTSTALAGSDGSGSSKAAGGTGGAAASGAGTGNPGSAGGTADLSGLGKAGGGGGGGGGARRGTGAGQEVIGGIGGDGGYPGGPSGGGGAAVSAGAFSSATGGPSGTPAHGCGFLVYKKVVLA